MFVLTDQDTIAGNFLAELRSEEVQKDSLRFRRNLERIGEIMAYEISKELQYEKEIIKTSLGESKVKKCSQQVVLAPVLRAGIPFFQGFLNYFDKAETAFVGSYRKVLSEEGDFEIQGEYTVAPDLNDKVLILIDPMLATGQSLYQAWQGLLKFGTPVFTYVASVVSSREGIKFINQSLKDYRIYTGDIDDKLNDKSYIVPGLGDAGDLAYGSKI